MLEEPRASHQLFDIARVGREANLQVLLGTTGILHPSFLSETSIHACHSNRYNEPLIEWFGLPGAYGDQ
jgi:hypothetical protein